MKGNQKMSSTTKTGKDTSLQGGVYFQTFRDLLKQREALDRQILRTQGLFFKMLDRNAKQGKKLPPKRVVAKMSGVKLSSKRYVARMRNQTILVEAIRECMIPGKRMGMQDVLEALCETGAYKTKSGYFYTMVNNKLNRDPRVKKVSRGVFVLKRRPGRVRKVAM